MMQYFILPNCCVAKIHKAGSTSLAEAIGDTFYPNKPKEDMVPWLEKPDRPVKILMRDPIERFISAITMFNSTVEYALENLLENIHFIPQSKYLTVGAEIYNFPEDIENFCKHTGLPSIPHLRLSTKIKAKITSAQRKKILNYYASDVRKNVV